MSASHYGGHPLCAYLSTWILFLFLFFSFFNTSFFSIPRWLCTSRDFIFRLLLKITVCSAACACGKKRIFCRGMCASKRWSPSFFNKNKNKKHSCMCDLKKNSCTHNFLWRFVQRKKGMCTELSFFRFCAWREVLFHLHIIYVIQNIFSVNV